jgi:hypothetical protein
MGTGTQEVLQNLLDGRRPAREPARHSGGKLVYEAFNPKDKTKVLEIRTAQGIHHAPAYAYLLNVISDGERGLEISLLFSFMAVDIKGKHLQALARALIKRESAFIQEYDGGKFAPPEPGGAVIESIAITARE